MWSIRETSDHGEATGEEVWQGGTGGMPLTEEFRVVTASGDNLSDYAAVWWDSKAKKVRGIWCADFNDKGCTPFEVTSRDSDIEMKGVHSNSVHGHTGRRTEESLDHCRREEAVSPEGPCG